VTAATATSALGSKAQHWAGPPVSAANFTVTNSFDPPDDEYYAARERRAFIQRNPDLYDAIECSSFPTASPATTHSIVSSTTSQTQSTTTTHRGSSSMTGRLSLGSSATGSLRSQPSSPHRKAAPKSGIDQATLSTCIARKRRFRISSLASLSRRTMSKLINFISQTKRCT